MRGLLERQPLLGPIAPTLERYLARVASRFDAQLGSDLPAVVDLVSHVERYRGKMLRPTLVLLSGLAAGVAESEATDALVIAGAVVEMVHMATLVHDDVLDDADVRRRGPTVNRLHGNEPAVILGDYLFAGAYHLCSQLEPATLAKRASLAVGRAAMTTCSGELLQLHHREDFSLDEPTYFEIIERKTADLIATSCELGALAAHGADAPVPPAAALARFGRLLGIAFQIRDDLLDLTGEAEAVGKSVGRDAAKGKMTLPLIHHLASLAGRDRARSLVLLERLSRGPDAVAERELLARVRSTGSIDHADARARALVAEARAVLDAIAPTGASPAVVEAMHALARAVVERSA